MAETIDPWQIKPLHDTTKPIAPLVADMRRHGWQGRPLLVIETATEYLAWQEATGSLRAREAGFDGVPCYVVQESDLAAVVDDPHFHCDDHDRMKILRLHGETAMRLLSQG